MVKKEILYKNFSYFDIPIIVLEKSYNQVKNLDDTIIALKFNRLIESYIVNEIKKDNIDIQIQVIDVYSRLKKMILINPKYNYDKDTISKAYEDAIELLKVRYNNNESLYNNLFENMKYILKNKEEKTIPKEEITYDLSFMKEYVNLYKVREGFLDIFDCDNETLNKYLNGELKAKEKDIKFLCNIYSLEDYDMLKKDTLKKIEIAKKRKEKELKENKVKKETKEIINKTKQVKKVPQESKKVKIVKKQIKPKEEEKRYDFSFLKQYAILCNIDKKELAEKLQCGIGRVDDILDGKLQIKESLLDDITYEFNANNYDDLKEKINKQINTILKNQNKNNKNYKTLYLEDLDKNKLFEILNTKRRSYKDILIIILLFTDIVDKTPKEISDFLLINEDYILKVYKDCLIDIKNYFIKEDKNIKLIYKNKEVD